MAADEKESRNRTEGSDSQGYIWKLGRPNIQQVADTTGKQQQGYNKASHLSHGFNPFEVKVRLKTTSSVNSRNYGFSRDIHTVRKYQFDNANRNELGRQGVESNHRDIKMYRILILSIIPLPPCHKIGGPCWDRTNDNTPESVLFQLS